MFDCYMKKLRLAEQEKKITIELFKAHRQLAEEMSEPENNVGTLSCLLKWKLDRFLRCFGLCGKACRQLDVMNFSSANQRLYVDSVRYTFLDRAAT